MDHSALERAVRRRSKDEVLTVLLASGLRDIASGGSGFQAVRHPLGFTCLPLSRESGADGVCVHIWPANPSPTRSTSAVHCHSWKLLSFVMCGDVMNQQYDLVDTPDGPYRLFDVQVSASDDVLVATDRLVDAVPSSTGIHSSGEFYELPAGDFHASSVMGTEAVTVVLGRHDPLGRDLSLGALDATPPRLRRERYTTDETTTIVRGLLARLSADVLAS